jgi:hypothetical protein
MHHAVEARQAWQKLVDDFRDNETLAGLATLIGVLEGDSATPFADHRALTAACRHLGDAVEPAARRLLYSAAELEIGPRQSPKSSRICRCMDVRHTLEVQLAADVHSHTYALRQTYAAAAPACAV